MMQENLTNEQIEQQDFVDNAIFNMLCELAPRGEVKWDIEVIGDVRDIVSDYFLEKGVIKSEKEFYPYFDNET